MKTEIAVVLPTYNARNTIIQTLNSILLEAKNSLIIVVDDNSPDKTAQIVENNFSKKNRIKLIIRNEKGGRGSAVIRGFQEGLKFPTIKYFIEMDADFAHDPKDILKLVNKAKKYDVVVASRYLLHSHIIKWSLKRRVISRLANLWIRFMLGIPLTDNTNGFRCYNRRVLESLNFNTFSSKGFIVLTEISNQIYKNKFSFGEIPINFIPEDLNKSNLNMREMKEAFFTILRLKFSRHNNIIK